MRKVLFSIMTIIFIGCTFMLSACNVGTTIAPKFSTVALGAAHGLAIDESGNLWTWGTNGSKQLGDGTRTDRRTLVQINAIKKSAIYGLKFSAVSAGETHSLAIDENGDLWAWGNNGCGQIGDGTTSDRSLPVQINAVKDSPINGVKFSQVSATYSCSRAIDADGHIWFWGLNTAAFLLPEPIAIMVASGGNQYFAKFESIYGSYAIDIEGNLWDSGTRDETFLPKYEPISELAGGKFDAVYSGSYFLPVFALDILGNIWIGGVWNTEAGGYDFTLLGSAVGYNSLGNKIFKVIATNLAIDEEDNLWEWRRDESSSIYVPIQLNSDNGSAASGIKFSFVATSAFGSQKAAIDEKGDLWTWGGGYLGNGQKAIEYSHEFTNIPERIEAVKK